MASKPDEGWSTEISSYCHYMASKIRVFDDKKSIEELKWFATECKNIFISAKAFHAYELYLLSIK